MFLFDDLFQLHRTIYVEQFGLATKVVYLLYGFLTILYLWSFTGVIRETEFLLLLAALASFAAAVLVDGSSFLPRGRSAVSDVFKLVGIMIWTSYICRTALFIARGKLK